MEIAPQKAPIEKIANHQYCLMKPQNPINIWEQIGISAPLNCKIPKNAGNTFTEKKIKTITIITISITGYIDAFIIFSFILSCFLNKTSILARVTSNSPASSPVFTKAI